jgi:hypothetical protein
MPHCPKCGAAVAEGVAFCPGCGQPGEGRVMFSVGDPTHRVALLTRAADWFDKYTCEVLKSYGHAKRARTLSGIEDTRSCKKRGCG